jgi:hypothetical protein
VDGSRERRLYDSLDEMIDDAKRVTKEPDVFKITMTIAGRKRQKPIKQKL